MEKQNKEKLSDKAFVRLILTSILGILVCVICLCSTTYAWFTGSVPNDSNKIQAADACLLSVSVYKDDTELEIEENGLELEKDGIYTVTLTLPKNSASGYCVINASGKSYYTEYIVRHEDDQAKTYSFTLRVANTQRVTFTVRWGIYSGEIAVMANGTLYVE